MAECVSECWIIDNHICSDHVPLKLTLDMNIEHNCTKERPFNVRTAWYKATDDDIAVFKKRLDVKLAKIELDFEALCCKYKPVIFIRMLFVAFIKKLLMLAYLPVSAYLITPPP